MEGGKSHTEMNTYTGVECGWKMLEGFDMFWLCFPFCQDYSVTRLFSCSDNKPGRYTQVDAHHFFAAAIMPGAGWPQGVCISSSFKTQRGAERHNGPWAVRFLVSLELTSTPACVLVGKRYSFLPDLALQGGWPPVTLFQVYVSLYLYNKHLTADSIHQPVIACFVSTEAWPEQSMGLFSGLETQSKLIPDAF